jgi:carbonic anhydrase
MNQQCPSGLRGIYNRRGIFVMNEEIKNLLEGNKQFQETYFGADRTLFNSLVAQGQQPKIMIVACSDSRVDPAMVFNCQPGQLFVVRNIANLVPPCETNDSHHGTSAALEFGVRFLHVEHIIIFGHTQCGGMQALLEHGYDADSHGSSFIMRWVDLARDAYDHVKQEHNEELFEKQLAICTQHALIHSLHNLTTFSWINQRVKEGTLQLHAWYFDLQTGMIVRYEQEKKRWHKGGNA